MIVTCPGCGRKFRTPESNQGRKARCGKCGSSVDIPAEMLLTELIEEPVEAAFLGGIPSAPRASGAWPARAVGRSPIRAGRPAWVVPVIVVGAIVVIGAVLWGSGVLRQTGIASGTVDIRKVIADPQAYAGQTLKSRVIMYGPEAFRGIGAIDSAPLMLMASPALEDKAENILQSIGEHQAVMIKYRIHDRAAFAKIAAYERAEERAEAEERRILAAGSDGAAVRIDVVDRVDKMRQTRSQAREREVGEKDPADYSGVLLEIWIP